MPLKIKWVSFNEVYSRIGQRYIDGPSHLFDMALFHYKTETILINMNPSGVPNLRVGPEQVFSRLITQLSVSLLHELGHWAGRRTHGKRSSSEEWDDFIREKVMESE